MTATIFATRRDAEQEITRTLGEYASEHDIDAIVDEVFVWATSSHGFILRPGVDFWAVVERHAR